MPVTVNILMAFPRFAERSFWRMAEICDSTGKAWPSPPLGMITVAALLPAHWKVRLIDCNIDPLSDDDILAADLVMTGGMIPQRVESLALIERIRRLGRPVVVGGPDATSSPEVFAAADFRVLGEAETVIGDFVAAWERGERSGMFVAEKFKTDVTQIPVPRYDLLKTDKYLSVSVQFSRGCPFTCEFCDIIELFGRVPRVKTADQVLAELEFLYSLGYRGIVDFVDDNLIGNKKAVKAFLIRLVEWQKAKRFPFEFYTEASINLADDAVLLQAMKEANFNLVFVGIETPDSATLAATRKKQNTRRDLAESVAIINRAGLQVHAGFIIGFDQEPGTIADDMIACIEATAIPVCMVGLLTALPKTQLSRRLEKEGRLDPEVDLDFAANLKNLASVDQCSAGLNFITTRPRRDILTDYRTVLQRIYEPRAFFERVRITASRLGGKAPTPRFEWRRFRNDLRALFGIVRGVVWRHPHLFLPFVRTLLQVAWANPAATRYALGLLVFSFDLLSFSPYLISMIEQEVAALDAGVHPRLRVEAARKVQPAQLAEPA